VYKSVWVHIVWVCILIFVWLRGKIHAGEWYYEDEESDFIKTSVCVYVCVCVYVLCMCVYILCV